MTEYRRVNIDGKSITETHAMAAALYPGTVVEIDSNNKFAAATTPFSGKRMYVLNDLCYDIRTTIREIETEYRNNQLKGYRA